MTIQVTQEAIDSAKRGNSARCMTARALILAGFESVRVTADAIWFNDANYRYMYSTPARAKHAVINFDAGKVVKPFPLVLKAGGDAGINHIVRRGPRLTPKAKHRVAYERTDAPRNCVRRYHGMSGTTKMVDA